MTDGDSGQTQLAIIGAGPGGYAAAFHAAELGMQVMLISRDARPGGVCLLRGCIPSKSLLHVAKLIYEARDAREWGVKFAEPKIDLDALRSWKDGVVIKLTDGLLELCKRRTVRFVQARARFEDSHTLRLEGESGPAEGLPERLRFDHAIVATGSLPSAPDALRVDDPRVMDSTAALNLADIPKRFLVVGGGYVGLEMGTVYAALGSEVTVVELTDGLLPGVDRDLVRALRPRLDERFKAIHLNAQVEKLEPRSEGVEATFKGKDIEPVQTFDRVLVAVGRRPASQSVGLENTQVKTDERGFVQADRQMRTADPAIWAVGDLAGEPMLAHKASREAKVAVEVIAGQKSEFDNVAIPAVVFTDPEVAWCGLTETQAKQKGQQVKVARFPWAASGRAATLGRSDGLTKLIFDPDTERLLGMGVAGPGAGELIAEGVLAVEMAAVATDVADSIHPHPTLSETVMESAEALLGRATHLFRPKR